MPTASKAKLAVILDSNTYVSDFRMTSPRFTALFDYLLKSGSELVLFKLVFDEVMECYRRIFEEKIGQRWEKGRGYLIDEALSPKPNVSAHVRALRKRLIFPKIGRNTIRTSFISEYKGADLEEVVRRGIKRVPPANQKGEELRDVILWLMTLDYFRRSGKQVAFISNDSGFWLETGTLRDEIARDLPQNGAKLSVYRTIEAFLAENGLTKREVDATWATQLFESSDMLSLLLGRAVPKNIPNAQLISSRLARVGFTAGSIYEVGTGHEFAELSFSVEASTEVDEEKITNYVTPNNLAMLAGPRENEVSVVHPFRQWLPISSPNYVYGSLQAVNVASPAFTKYVLAPQITKLRKQYLLSMECEFSVRLIRGSPQEMKLESFTTTKSIEQPTNVKE